MHINWSSRELQVFLTLADTLSFRRTAERVHLSQPAVTGVIARVEESLGVKLFDRTTRQVQLTGAGLVFVEQAQRLLSTADDAARAVRNVAMLQVGQLAIAALPSLAATVVPAAFAKFSKAFPGIKLQLMDTLSGPAFEMVRAGTVEFALTAANPAYADLDYLPLTSDGFVLLIPNSYPLAKSKNKGPLTWKEVADLAHISMPLPSSVRQYADAAFLEHRVRFSPAFEVEHLVTIKALVSAGLGVAALPELAAAVGPDRGITRRALTQPDLRRPIGLVTRRGRSLSPAAVAMVEFLKAEMKPEREASQARPD